MKTKKTKAQSPKPTTVKSLEPRDDREVKGGTETLSLNFDKVTWKYWP